MSISPWKKIGETEVVASGYGKRLDRQKFLDHAGRETEFFFLEQPSWSMVLPLTKDGDVVLVRQYKQGVDRIIEETPGGTANFAGEDPEQVMQRELLEETGYSAGSVIYLGSGNMNSRSSRTVFHCFLAKDCQKTAAARLDDTEEIETIEKPLQEWVTGTLDPRQEEWGMQFLLLKALPYLDRKIADVVCSILKK